jgi:hypothetical protein
MVIEIQNEFFQRRTMSGIQLPRCGREAPRQAVYPRNISLLRECDIHLCLLPSRLRERRAVLLGEEDGGQGEFIDNAWRRPRPINDGGKVLVPLASKSDENTFSRRGNILKPR